MCQHDLSRRSFLRAGSGLIAAAAIGGCTSSPAADRDRRNGPPTSPAPTTGPTPVPSSEPTPVAVAPAPAGATRFRPLQAVRIADTDRPARWTRIDAERLRVPVAGAGGVPTTAVAAALRVTGTVSSGGAAVTVVPAGAVASVGPASSATCFVQLAAGAVDVLHSDIGAAVTVDVVGYFEAVATATSGGRTVATAPTTVLDTVATARPFAAGETRWVDVDAATPIDAMAVVVHAMAGSSVGRWTVHSAGAHEGPATLVTGPGRGLTATTVVPVEAGGFEVTASDGGHLSLEIVAHMTGDRAAVSVDGLFVPTTPVRVLDTRAVRQPVPDGSSREVAVGPPQCAALAVQVTTVAVAGTGSTTIWDAGGPPRLLAGRVAQGDVGTATSYHAVAPAGRRGIAIGSWGGEAHVIADVYGWFTGERTTTREPVLGAQPYGIQSVDMESYADEWFDYGTSDAGRPLRAFRHGSGPLIGLITTGIHGDEHTGTSVLADLVTHDAVAGWTLWLVPAANPDARAANARFVRDVDMNRDFPVEWSPLPGPTPSGCVTARTGPTPHSLVESERLAVAMIDGAFRGATISVSHHDNYNWVAPQSGSPAVLRELADAYAMSTGLRLPGENGSIVPTSPRTTRVKGGFETFAHSLGMSSFLVENKAGYVGDDWCAGVFGTQPDPAAVAPHREALRALLTDGRLPTR
jgi:hypothetical protein